MSTFSEWSNVRLAQWTHEEYWHSNMGQVIKVNGGFIAKVRVGERLGRIAETYMSAEVAMGAVERTWKRERSYETSTILDQK